VSFDKLHRERSIMADYPKNSNPFMTEEDDDWSGKRTERGKIQEQIYASEDRQLDATMRALRSIQESESMGVATAEVSFCFLCVFVSWGLIFFVISKVM
jgi:hypothetical protein